MSSITREKQFISPQILFPMIEEILKENKKASFTVTGMSMWPFLCHGRDQVIIESVDAKKLKKGDVILFRATPEKYMMHRITKRYEGSFETTGDGNLFRDGVFEDTCIIGQITEFVRRADEENSYTIHCEDIPWKSIFQIWMFLFPVRKYIFKVWFKIRPLIRA